ncbi:hypothetical protein AVEN_170513-1 [Araneus ventricosus]|uniref:Uncharacterized protein n=1 Tax=Araneus ventricosus TaxID=182803 RepID=A0A4Y2C233_ARAVE|nr:hypothetical protein AVEN_170513-1 [Araneus ventricosus]
MAPQSKWSYGYPDRLDIQPSPPHSSESYRFCRIESRFWRGEIEFAWNGVVVNILLRPAPRQNQSSVRKTEENWSGSLYIQPVWISNRYIWTAGP